MGRGRLTSSEFLIYDNAFLQSSTPQNLNYGAIDLRYVLSGLHDELLALPDDEH
jgi:hypothetical protein